MKDKVDQAVLAAAHARRPEADQLELLFPGTRVWFGVFTGQWWAYLPTASHQEGLLTGPAPSSETLKTEILAAQRDRRDRGRGVTWAGSAPRPPIPPDPASCAPTPTAHDAVPRGAEPFASTGSAPRIQRRGGRHARP